MKYVLLFCGNDEDARAFAALSPDELRQRHTEVLGWLHEYRDRIVYSERLEAPNTATTVRHDSACDGDAIAALCTDESHAAVAAVFREEAGHITAWLVLSLGDFPTAEEIVQEALVAALEQWPLTRIPGSPRAWLRTVVRRKA